ncbi:MAG TPA: hypothetical protein VFH88_09580, partial [Candidatus Krumholzibacteria bacterium]|nr:hypothetical protein [Candidatus Krumholzibacteria bacterium]
MRLHLVVLTAFSFAFSSSVAFAGGAITSGTTTAGTVSGPSYIDAWTFSGTSGNRIVITAITTSGSLNTNIVLKAPGGAVETTSGSGDRLDWQLASTGTYTVQIQDYALANAGDYAIGFLNVTAGPLTGGGDTDGGPIVSADVKAGTMSGPADLDAFTFSGTMGNRILIDCVATAGPGFNTEIVLYPPGGGPFLTYTIGDRLDVQLTSSGTWTAVIEDYGDDAAGSYSLSLLNVTAGPISNGADPDGGAIGSNEIKTGQFQDGVDFDAYTFFGFAGTRVLISAVTTGGSANTNTTLFPPGGVAAVTSTSADAFDWQLPVSGTYTIVVEDLGNDNTGTYTVSMVNITSGPLTTAGDPDGGPLTSSDVKNGTISGPGDFDVFTFQGNFGDRVIIDAVETAGVGFNTIIALYAPNGGPYATYTAGNRLEFQVNVTGTWAVVIEDNGLDTPGSYALSFLNVTTGPLTKSGDPDGGPIASNEIRSGAFQQGVDFDGYTFNGNAGQRIIFTAVATGGGSQNTNITLYPPGGGPAETGTSADQIDWQLAATGTYTVVVEDVGNDDTGTYTVSYVNLTAGPLTDGSDADGGPITSAAVKSGTISGVADLDAFTFSGNSGDRVLIDAVATAGASFNTVIVLYPPNGGSYVTYTGGDRLEYQLNATGTWTILIEDNGADTAGSYDLSLLNITSGPTTSGSDPDGGVLVSNTMMNGQFNQGVDFDAYTFTATAGNRVILTGVITGGTANTNLTLYPPNGGPAETGTSGDAIDWQVAQTGTYTLVLEDVGDDNTGTYTVSYLNLTAGPLTDGTDPDGGPITSAGVKTGTISGTGDLDAFTFTGNLGDRVLIDAVATSGASFNTVIVLYPPNGGSYAAYTGADRVDYQLTATGTWTILIEDNGLDNAGDYELSLLNITSGPITSGSDTDGGPIVSNEIKNGQFNQGVDFDAYTFNGFAGQRILFVAVATGVGGHNTNISLYPPGGRPAETGTSGDALDAQLQRSGIYTVVVEDVGNNNTGT